MPVDVGLHSERIAQVRTLREPRGRREQGRYAFEGPTLLDEARRAGVPVRELYVTAAAERTPQVAALEREGVAVYRIPERAMARISDVETPSGILAVTDLPAPGLEAALALPGPVLLLAGIADPGNAGTLIRAAEAFGAVAVVAGAGGVDPYAPKVVRAAMGSSFRLPILVAGADELVEAAAAARRRIVVADLTGADLDRASLDGPLIVAIGNERHGAAWLPRFDLAVRIPHAGPAESLNAAVAGGVLLYEIGRRERARSLER